MTLLQIWKRIGKQPLRITRNKKAVVFLGNKEYEITGIRYKDGKWIGFELDDVYWHDVEDYPKKEDAWIIVKDKNGKEYDAHRWLGHAYYEFSIDDDGVCDGYRSRADIIAWKYDYDFKWS